jgi:hypothetical protein
VTIPWWRSGFTLPVHSVRSFQVTTAGFTDRFLRHQGSLARTDVVDSGSAALLKADASFTIRPGLADSSCYSLEARNFPGSYLRHSAFRVRLDGVEDSDLYRRDATFCAQPGSAPGSVRLASINELGASVRHYNSEVWVASNGGAHAFDNAWSYPADVSWAVTAPWAP